MGLIRAGKLIISPNRNVTIVDSTYPTGDTTGVEVPQDARGVITHLWVTITGSAASPSAIVTIFGLPYITNEKPQFSTTHQGIWMPLASVNDGGAITQTTISPTAPANNIGYYAESFLHLSPYRRLFAYVTSFTSITSVDVQFAFEAL